MVTYAFFFLNVCRTVGSFYGDLATSRCLLTSKSSSRQTIPMKRPSMDEKIPLLQESALESADTLVSIGREEEENMVKAQGVCCLIL